MSVPMDIGLAPSRDRASVQGVVRQDEAIDLVGSPDVGEMLCILLHPEDVVVATDQDLPTIHAAQEFETLCPDGDVATEVDGVLLTHDGVMRLDHHLVALCGIICPGADTLPLRIGEGVNPIVEEVMV